MSLRNMEVQYVGDTLYLPPLEREVKHIIVRGVKDWEHFEPVVRCKDCRAMRVKYGNTGIECWMNGEPFTVDPDGFCAWGERRSE